MTLDYCPVFPWAVFIRSNGGLEMFVIDSRTYPNQYGLLPFIADETDFVGLGTNFGQFLDKFSDL